MFARIARVHVTGKYLHYLLHTCNDGELVFPILKPTQASVEWMSSDMLYSLLVWSVFADLHCLSAPTIHARFVWCPCMGLLFRHRTVVLESRYNRNYVRSNYGNNASRSRNSDDSTTNINYIPIAESPNMLVLEHFRFRVLGRQY